MNNVMPDEENRLTPKEVDILYKLYTYNSEQINTATKQRLMDDFHFSSKTQIGAYISILFRKKAIFRSAASFGAYSFNPVFLPPKDADVSEIIIRFDGEEEGD
jgi:hypothetical protein